MDVSRVSPLRCASPVKLRCPSATGIHGSTSVADWRRLLESISAKIVAAEARPLNVALKAPFVTASTTLDEVRNVAIRVELSDGSIGWGEAGILPPITAEDQEAALEKTKKCCSELVLKGRMTGLGFLEQVGDVLPGHELASSRAGVEMAIFDAVARSTGLPLWKLFGGNSSSITTDITIPISEPAEAAQLAKEYADKGFKTVKCKVGGRSISLDIAMLLAVRSTHPDCELILDANEGYTADEAMRVLKELYESGVTPLLLEQPVARDDWEGLAAVSKHAMEHYGVPVAADESCRSLADAKRIVDGKLAGVINVKLAKLGVLGTLDVILLAWSQGIDLMIGGMVETRLAMGFAGQLAAGFGLFKYIDLDTPLLLAEDPVEGGYEVNGPVYSFTNAPGHGGSLRLFLQFVHSSQEELTATRGKTWKTWQVVGAESSVLEQQMVKQRSTGVYLS